MGHSERMRISQLRHPNFPERMLTKRYKEGSSDGSSSSSGLTTTNACGSLLNDLSDAHGLTPLERIVLTCNGNSQVVFSAYYLQQVDLSVNRFEPAPSSSASDEGSFASDDVDGSTSSRPPLAASSASDEGSSASDDCDGSASSSRPPLAVYDREACMSVAGHVYCKATSRVRIYDEGLLDALKNQHVGIGQLLRWKNLHPAFTLHDAGRNDHGGMWRFYSLECRDMIEFDILEEFTDNAFSLPCMQKL